jgi:spore germination protein GerM
LNRFFAYAALTAALGLAASGCHDQTSTSPGSPPGPPSTVTQTAPGTTAPPAKVVAYVLNPKATGDQDLLVARPVTLLHPQSPAQDALTELLQSDHSPIAPGTALRGVSIDNGVATVDFSQSPVNETGGEDAQSAALNALAMTLGQFPDISTYQIEVKGQPVKSFGEFDTDGPMEVIRPGDKPKAEGSAQ